MKRNLFTDKIPILYNLHGNQKARKIKKNYTKKRKWIKL